MNPQHVQSRKIVLFECSCKFAAKLRTSCLLAFSIVPRLGPVAGCMSTQSEPGVVTLSKKKSCWCRDSICNRRVRTAMLPRAAKARARMSYRRAGLCEVLCGRSTSASSIQNTEAPSPLLCASANQLASPRLGATEQLLKGRRLGSCGASKGLVDPRNFAP